MIVFCTDATGRQDRAQPLMVSNLRMARQWAHGYNGYCRSLSADPLKLHQLPLFLVVPKLLLLAFTSGNSKSSPNIASIYTTNQCLDERRGVWKQQLVTTYGNYLEIILCFRNHLELLCSSTSGPNQHRRTHCRIAW